MGLKSKFLCGLFIAGVSSGYAADQAIPVVGLREDGAPVESIISESAYTEKLKTALTGVEKSTLQALSKQQDKGKPWLLRSVVVGVGVNAEVMLGPLVKFGVLPRFRLGFSNAKEPSIP